MKLLFYFIFIPIISHFINQKRISQEVSVFLKFCLFSLYASFLVCAYTIIFYNEMVKQPIEKWCSSDELWTNITIFIIWSVLSCWTFWFNSKFDFFMSFFVEFLCFVGLFFSSFYSLAKINVNEKISFNDYIEIICLFLLFFLVFLLGLLLKTYREIVIMRKIQKGEFSFKVFKRRKKLKFFIIKTLKLNSKRNIIYKGYNKETSADFLVCTVENFQTGNIATVYSYKKIQGINDDCFCRKIRNIFVGKTYVINGEKYHIEKLNELHVVNINQKAKTTIADYLEYKRYGL